jgi:glutamate/aspartate transport system substrate-binding protein
MNKLFTPLLTALVITLPSFASAAEPSATLRKIADSGSIAVGYHESTPPFTYISDGKIMGYSWDIAQKIADAVQRELKLPKLAQKPIIATTQNRFALVQNGVIDFHCGATTHTRERQQMVAFSNTNFIAGTRLMTRKDSGIKEFTDLGGKSVVTFARSTSEKILKQLNAEQNRHINIVTAFDRGEGPVSVLQAGHADAYMMDDVLLYASITETWRPDEWMVTGAPQSFEAYACVLPKDDPTSKKLVDTEIARIMKSGEALALYRKWLQSPIPPQGLNLALPISQAMLDLYQNPNDKPFD